MKNGPKEESAKDSKLALDKKMSGPIYRIYRSIRTLEPGPRDKPRTNRPERC